MAFITLDNVSKLRDEKRVLDGVSFDVKKGEVVVLFGPSGSGKSTLLRCINRLIEADAGSIGVDGKDVKDYDPIELRRKVGMVFQQPALFDGTVGENVSYGPSLRGEVDERVVIKAVGDAGLDASFLERDASKLSGGEQQRVSLARALALEPSALLLDEPTASLDGEAAAKVEAAMRVLKETRGLAIVWVTHDPAQARRVADRVVVLRDGKVVLSAVASKMKWGDLSG